MEPTYLRVLSQNGNTFELPSIQPLQMFVIKILNHGVRDWYNRTPVPTGSISIGTTVCHCAGFAVGYCRTELNTSPEKSDLPSVLGIGLSKGGGVDFMLFPMSLSPGAVEGAGSLQ